MRRVLLGPVLVTLLSACFGSHGGSGSPDAALPPADARPLHDSSAPPLDARPLRDALTPQPDAPSETCAFGRSGLAVNVVPIGTGATRHGCGDGAAFSGAALSAVTVIPEGIELHLDLCPDADDDCRCLVTVRGSGSDAVPELAPGEAVSGALSSYGVVIEGAPSCPGCEGDVRPVVFLAASGPPEMPPVRADALAVRWGDPTCSEPPDSAGCVFVRRQLVFTAFVDGFPGPIGFETPLDEGATERLEPSGVHARVLFSHGRECGDGSVARASWVAWR